MMTRLLLITALIGAMPLTMAAQDDDLYFVPKKQAKQADENSASCSTGNTPTYYCGTDRDVDEYNRHGKLRSYYQKIGTDSLGNDIIEFHSSDTDGATTYADSTISIYPGSERYYDNDDYAFCRRMSRFDDFYGWYPSYYYGYWNQPYWRSLYGWYDPWYAGWYGMGWYSPWYYDSFYAWGYPYYGWRGWPSAGIHYRYDGPSGTRNHAGYGGRFYGSRINTTGSSNSNSFNRSFNSSFNRKDNSDNNSSFERRRSSFNSNYTPTQRQTQRQPSQSFGQSSFGSSRGSFGGGSGFGGGSRGGSFGGGHGGGFGSRR